MTKKIKITAALILFLAVVIFYMYGLLYVDKIAFFSKPLLMAALVAVYLASVKNPDFWYISALIFSFWGDVFLLFKDEFFLYGLASFLFAHLLFIKISAGFLKKIKTQKIVLFSLPFIIILISLLMFLKDDLGELLIPVIVYGVTICTFGVIALLIFYQEKSTQNLWLFLGAFIFIISDSILAIDKFHETKEIYGIIIITTYIVAQYLICKAMVSKNSYQ